MPDHHALRPSVHVARTVVWTRMTYWMQSQCSCGWRGHAWDIGIPLFLPRLKFRIACWREAHAHLKTMREPRHNVATRLDRAPEGP